MDACTAEPEIGEIEVAVRATAEADEALAATRAFVHGVRHSVGSGAFGRVGADLDQAGTGMSSAGAARLARPVGRAASTTQARCRGRRRSATPD